jgi:hypothetical protein
MVLGTCLSDLSVLSGRPCGLNAISPQAKQCLSVCDRVGLSSFVAGRPALRSGMCAACAPPMLTLSVVSPGSVCLMCRPLSAWPAARPIRSEQRRRSSGRTRLPIWVDAFRLRRRITSFCVTARKRMNRGFASGDQNAEPTRAMDDRLLG